jgi:hypothetical protein
VSEEKEIQFSACGLVMDGAGLVEVVMRSVENPERRLSAHFTTKAARDLGKALIDIANKAELQATEPAPGIRMQ